MRALLVPLVALATACGPTFTPRSVVEDLRVLAVVADPLEAGPTDTVTLNAVRLLPPGSTIGIVDERWTFCPFSIGSTAGYACAVPACETALTPTGAPTPYVSAPVRVSPGALALQCIAQLSGGGTLPPDVPGQLPEVVDTIVRYVVTAGDGSSREAVQRLPLYPGGAPADRNQPPLVSTVSIGGVAVVPGAATDLGPDPTDPTLGAGATLEVRVQLAPDSAQTYVEGGRTLTEQLVVSFYATAGRFDYDWANGPDASVKLKGEDLVAGTTGAQLWVVARDLRGGETVEGPYWINVAP